jgi:hypothetical protein
MRQTASSTGWRWRGPSPRTSATPSATRELASTVGWLLLRFGASPGALMVTGRHTHHRPCNAPAAWAPAAPCCGTLAPWWPSPRASTTQTAACSSATVRRPTPGCLRLPAPRSGPAPAAARLQRSFLICLPRPADPAQHSKAIQGLGPHTAPLGARFYRPTPDTMFPPEYNNTMFIAIHGSLHRWAVQASIARGAHALSGTQPGTQASCACTGPCLLLLTAAC